MSDDDIYDRIMRKTLGLKHTIYSVLRGGQYQRLDAIAVLGKARFRSATFGPEWTSDVVENATWLELCVVFEEMVKQTGDRHHVFFEGLCRAGEVEGIPVYVLIRADDIDCDEVYHDLVVMLKTAAEIDEAAERSWLSDDREWDDDWYDDEYCED
jgi:hypothetical protein